MKTRLLFIICFLLLSLLKAQIITTIAGNGTNAYTGDGGQATAGNNPTCIWKPTEDDGTYFYTIQYTINCNNEKQNRTLKGFVTVIR